MPEIRIKTLPKDIKLLHIWFAEQKTFHNQNINFSSPYIIEGSLDGVIISKNIHYNGEFFQPLTKSLTAIIGRNATGKTNLYEFILGKILDFNIINNSDKDKFIMCFSTGGYGKIFVFSTMNLQEKITNNTELSERNIVFADYNEGGYILNKKFKVVFYTSDNTLGRIPHKVAQSKNIINLSNNYITEHIFKKIIHHYQDLSAAYNRPLSTSIQSYNVNERLPFVLSQLRKNTTKLELSHEIPLPNQLYIRPFSDNTLRVIKRYIENVSPKYSSESQQNYNRISQEVAGHVFNTKEYDSFLNQFCWSIITNILEIIFSNNYYILIYIDEIIDELLNLKPQTPFYFKFKKILKLIYRKISESQNEEGAAKFLENHPIDDFINIYNLTLKFRSVYNRSQNKFLYPPAFIDEACPKLICRSTGIVLDLSDRSHQSFIEKLSTFLSKNYLLNELNLEWMDLSTGENMVLDLFGKIHNLFSHYPNENFIFLFDEIDAGLHPDWQRRILYNLFKIIPKLSVRDASTQIVFTSHSPLLLSDIPTSNILLFRNGENGTEVVNGNSGSISQTFLRNIHTILSENFFLDKLAGEFALKKIEALIKELNENEDVDLEEAIKTASIIGESFIRNNLIDKIQDMHHDRT